MEDFTEDLALLSQRIRGSLEVEGHARRGEHPSGVDCLTAVRDRSALLWTRRRDGHGYAELRLGLGTRPSRSAITMPAVGRLQGRGMARGVGAAARPRGRARRAGRRDAADRRSHRRRRASAPTPSVRPVRSCSRPPALHSPAELAVCSFASGSSARDWDFLKWLPHTTSPHSPIGTDHLAASAPACSALADALEDVLEAKGTAKGTAQEQEQAGAGRPTVLVLVESDAPIDRSRLVAIAERGHRAGYPRRVGRRDPAAAPGRVPHVPRRQRRPELPRRLRPRRRGGAARRRRPHRLRRGDGLRTSARARRRRRRARRRRERPAAGRLAPHPRRHRPRELRGGRHREVGRVALDPHRPVRPGRAAAQARQPARHRRPVEPGHLLGRHPRPTARTPSSAARPAPASPSCSRRGSSAWPQRTRPQRVTFLLVDYKGGSAFRDCVKLPHTVGLVTDLSPHLVRRALASLAAELHYREHLLARHKAKDLVELERRGEVEAPPSLIIVVDEFAALVQEVPEFVDGVVNVAQRGRSLGLHLILATQRPPASSRTTSAPTPTCAWRCAWPTRTTPTTCSGPRRRPSSTRRCPVVPCPRPVPAASSPSRRGMPVAGRPTCRRRPT